MRSLGMCPLKAWQTLGTEWMEHKGVGSEVLEAFSRTCSPIQAYLPGSLSSSLHLHAPCNRVLTTSRQLLPSVDSSDCWHALLHSRPSGNQPLPTLTLGLRSCTFLNDQRFRTSAQAGHIPVGWEDTLQMAASSWYWE